MNATIATTRQRAEDLIDALLKKRVDTLPLISDADKVELTERLSQFLQLLSEGVLPPRGSQKKDKARLKRVSNAIGKLETIIGRSPEVHHFWVMEGEFPSLDKHLSARPSLDMRCLNECRATLALELLRPIKKKIDNERKSKGGNAGDSFAEWSGAFLAHVYHDATGRRPGYKDGSCKGPFYCFVKEALDGIYGDVNIVTKKGKIKWQKVEAQLSDYESVRLFHADRTAARMENKITTHENLYRALKNK